MKNIVSILFAVSIIMFACNTNGGDTKGLISGKINGATPGKIYMEELTTNAINVVDSVALKPDGAFAFKHEVKSAGFYRVRMENDSFITLIVEPGVAIQITADANALEESHTTVGSTASSSLKKLNTFVRDSYAEVNQLETIFQNARNANVVNIDSVQLALQARYEKLMAQREGYVRNVIDTGKSALVSLAAISYLTPDKDFESYRKVSEQLQLALPNSSYTAEFSGKVSQMQKLARGSQAPEINLASTEGKNIPLSSLKGKYVLIDFWAAWCGPCRKENPNLVKLYAKYKDKGFEIYGVSLDNNKEAWLKAIQDDKLTWLHVSDLQRWDSPVAKLYNIEGIPNSYLIDPQGVIIEKGLRSEALDVVLGKLLQ